MAARNMRSSSASTSCSSDLSPGKGRTFASQRWGNEIPSRSQRDIIQGQVVRAEQPIMPDGSDGGYRSNEQDSGFPWRNTHHCQGSSETFSSNPRRAAATPIWQCGVGQGKGGRWQGNFVEESGHEAPRERAAREPYNTGNRTNNRGAPVRLEDGWEKERSPKGRGKQRVPGNGNMEHVASSPLGYPSPGNGGSTKSYQRRKAEEEEYAREVRNWKMEERGVATSQETKPGVDHQSKFWQRRDLSNVPETVAHKQLELVRPHTNWDQREWASVASTTTTYKDQRSSTSSDLVSRGLKETLPMVTYKKSIMELDFEEAALPITGTCRDMCPAAERDLRQQMRDLAVFERLGGNQFKTSPELAVKKFCRTFSSRDLQHQDVRPFSVLRRTMDYLLKLLDSRDYSYQVVYDFLFDRMRAVRQELGMQQIIHKHAVMIYENIVRFYVLSEHILRKESSFDSHSNLEQLSKALISLLNLYFVNTKNSEAEFPHEAEFHCYYVLLNLGNHSGVQVENLASWFRTIKPVLLKTPDMRFARNVLRSYQMGNFKWFFKLVEEATLLQACLMELYFNEVRSLALSAINYGGYKLHPYPLQALAKLLLIPEEDLEDFCKINGLLVEREDSNSRCLVLKQVKSTTMHKGKPWYCCSTIDKKCASSFLQEVIGRAIA